MQYNDLGLNRLGFKQEQSYTPLGAAEMSNTIDSRVSNNINEQGTNVPKPVKQIDPGSIIVSCPIKTSDEKDRIEMGTNLQQALEDTSFTPIGSSAVDFLGIFRAGILNGFITAQGNMYLNYVQPVMKYIRYSNALSSGNLDQNISLVLWDMAQSGTGVYLVTHNIGHTNYSVSITPESFPYYGAVYNMTSTTFEVRTFNSGGAAVNSYWNCNVFINPV